MNSLVKKMTAVGMILGGLTLFTACAAKTATDTPADMPAVLVEAGKVAAADISEISTVNGKLAANVEVSVVPKMAGKVAEVNFAVGDRVKKGDVLVRLTSDELQAQLNQAQAFLKTAQAAYAAAQKNLTRMQSLYAQGAISQLQLEAAQTGVISGSPAAAAATVQLIQAQLANTVISSPMDGIVSTRSVEVGEIAGQGAVMTIVDMDTVVVNTTVTEGEVNKLVQGQAVNVSVAAVGSSLFQGRVTTISPAADSRTSAFPVQIAIANPQHLLKPGMFAEIKLNLSTKKAVLVVDKAAVVDSGEGKYVFVVKDGQALQMIITTGVEDDTRVEVLSGLAAGDIVVLSGQNKLQDKSPVTVSSGIK